MPSSTLTCRQVPRKWHAVFTCRQIACHQEARKQSTEDVESAGSKEARPFSRTRSGGRYLAPWCGELWGKLRQALTDLTEVCAAAAAAAVNLVASSG